MTDEKKENLFSRRAFIANTVKLAAAGAIIPGALSQLLPMVAPDALGGGGEQPIVRRGRRNEKIPITLSDLAGDPPVVVTAEYAFLPAVVYKVKRAVLQASTNFQGYNTAQHALDHPTEPEHVILVYDGKCKHLGCTVGWDGSLGGAINNRVGQEDYDQDGVKDGRILCPCHQGQYDIYNLALNQPGTPPPEPLNVVRAKIDVADVDGVKTANAIIGIEKIIQGAYRDADELGDGAPFQTATQLRLLAEEAA